MVRIGRTEMIKDELKELGFTSISKINGGGQGEIYTAKSIDTNQIVTIKSLIPMGMNFHKQRKLEIEAQVLQEITKGEKIPFCPKYIGRVGKQEAIVMEYLEGSPLDKVYKSTAKDNKTMIKRLKEFREIVKLFEKLKRKYNYYHRDIKLSNIMMHNGVPKLLDFGNAITTKREKVVNTTSPISVVVSGEYLAPDILGGNRSSESSETYMLGIVLHKIMIGDKKIQLFGVMGPPGTEIERAKRKQHEYSSMLKKSKKNKFELKSAKRIDNVIQKATTFQVKNRYRTFNDLIDAITKTIKYVETNQRNKEMQKAKKKRRNRGNI